MKIVKFFVGFFIILVVLITASSIAINSLVDFNQFSPEIEKRLEDKTGLDWQIKGPIKLAIFPSVKLSVADISAKDTGNAKMPQLKGQSFAFEKAQAHISWFPHVFSKSVVLNEIALNNLDYIKPTPDGGKMNVLLKSFALEDIFVGFADVKNGALDIRPNTGSGGVPINVAAAVKQNDKAGKMLNAIDATYEAVLDYKSMDAFALNNGVSKLNIKLPNLKGNGVDVTLKADVNAALKAKKFDIKNLNLTALNQVVNGQAAVILSGAVPRIDFDLKAKDVKAETFLAVLQKPENAMPKAPKPLPNFTVNGKLHVDKLSFNKYVVDTLDATITGANSTYKIAPLTLAMYDGQGVFDVAVRGQSVPANCVMNADLSSLNMGKLLLAAANKDIFTGAMAATGNIALPCLAGPIDISKAKGALDTTISDGVIQKWGVSKGLNKALSVAKALEDGSLTGVAAVQQALSVQEGDDRFEFTEIVANMTLANGIANNTKFNLSAPLSDIQGAGQVDLVKQVIDYGLKLNLSKNKGNNENYIPIKITGPLTKPSYKIDTESLLKAKAGTEVKEKIKDKIGKELGDKVGGDILKALPF